MSEIALLKVLFTERLSAVAVEIFDAVETTFVKYKEDVHRSYEEKYRLLQLYSVPHSDRDSTIDRQQFVPVSGEDGQQGLSASLSRDSELPRIQGDAFSISTRVKEEELEDLEDPSEFLKLNVPFLPVLSQGSHCQAVGNKEGRPLSANITKPIKTQTYRENYETTEPASRSHSFRVVTVDCSAAEGFRDGESSGLRPEPNLVKSRKTGEKKGQSSGSEKTSKCKVEPVSGESSSHRCQECGKCFSQNDDLIAHTRQHRGEKPYECLVCGKGFSTKVGHDMHVRRHSGEKPYQCKECGKSFVHDRYLSLHMRLHTGEKLYQCRQCGRYLNHKCRLIDHMRRHKGEKPFKCQECEKCFYRRGELTIHMRIHSGEKPHECTVCGKQFSLPQSLRRHMRTHTNK